MLDRTKAPEIKDISVFKIPLPNRYELDNGIPVYETKMGEQDILKVEVVFHAGRPFEKKKLAARATAAMLKEGTKVLTSAEIAEKIDFYGGTFSTPVNLDYSAVTLYSLSKHFERLLALLAEMILEPVFPQKELDTFIERNIQRLSVDLSRNDVVAYRKITECIYSDVHPYGYNSTEENYRALTREDLIEHFNANYHTGNCRIFISGKTNDTHIELLNKYLGNSMMQGVFKKPTFNNQEDKPQKVTIPFENSLQTAIRIGKRLFPRTHQDFNGMYVLNTILGGYFGSRLMANIREDKGYTYNIFSSLDPMTYDGYFYIGTEVGNEFTEKAIKEIHREIEILQNDLVGEEELSMVKNYLLGNLMTMIDGAFNVADLVKAYVAEGLPVENFNQFTQDIKDITAEELRQLAQKHLNVNEMWRVLVG